MLLTSLIPPQPKNKVHVKSSVQSEMSVRVPSSVQNEMSVREPIAVRVGTKKRKKLSSEKNSKQTPHTYHVVFPSLRNATNTYQQ